MESCLRSRTNRIFQMSYFIPNWRAGMQAVSAAIDGAFGERLTLIACLARPNFPTEPDASIKPVTLQASSVIAQNLLSIQAAARADSTAAAGSCNPKTRLRPSVMPHCLGCRSVATEYAAKSTGLCSK